VQDASVGSGYAKVMGGIAWTPTIQREAPIPRNASARSFCIARDAVVVSRRPDDVLPCGVAPLPKARRR
jgi:hypothetical protein